MNPHTRLAAALLIGGCTSEHGGTTNADNAAMPHDTSPPEAALPANTDGPDPKLSPAPQPQRARACLTQDGKPVPPNRLRAIGTEPFWSARIEGRCVTYSHPEDQNGTRVWTKFSPGTQGGVWIGTLGGKPFELRTRAAPGCSDGMSDNRYPIAVTLLVNGERRTGCARPL